MVISATCVEGGRDIIGSIQSCIETFVDEFARAFMETNDSESIEDTFLYFVVSLFNEWPMIEARAKSLFEGVRFSAKLIQAEECASDTENIHEEDEGTRAEEASVAGSKVDSQEEPLAYNGKGKQRAAGPRED